MPLRIIIYAKYPDPGRVKTRLAASIGDREAAELYTLFVEDIVSTCGNGDWEISLHFFPPADEGTVRSWLPGRFGYHEQSGIDLGVRMAESFAHEFTDSASSTLLVGTDIPQLNEEIITRAFACLNTHDAVIGPAADGGYYLIGFNASSFTSAVFNDISWSSDQVYADQLQGIKREGLSCASLSAINDIDTLEDLQAFQCEYADRSAAAPRTLAWLNKNRGIF